MEPHALAHALSNAFVESNLPSGLAPKLTTLFEKTIAAEEFRNIKGKKRRRKPLRIDILGVCL